MRPALLLLAVLVPAILRADPGAFPERFAAQFTLESHGATIARTRWTVAPVHGGRFVYESRTEPAGFYALVRDESIVERSEWRYGEDGLEPIDYRYLRSGGKRERDIRVAFDWDHGVALNTARGETWQMDIPRGTLDKLSYLLALMRDLGVGKDEFAYTIADGGRLKRYELRALGRETLATALGNLDTVKVRRLRDDDERDTVLWCAPALAFLPVRIEHREDDGTMITLELRSVEGLGAPPPAPDAARS